MKLSKNAVASLKKSLPRGVVLVDKDDFVVLVGPHKKLVELRAQLWSTGWAMGVNYQGWVRGGDSAPSACIVAGDPKGSPRTASEHARDYPELRALHAQHVMKPYRTLARTWASAQRWGFGARRRCARKSASALDVARARGARSTRLSATSSGRRAPPGLPGFLTFFRWGEKNIVTSLQQRL